MGQLNYGKYITVKDTLDCPLRPNKYGPGLVFWVEYVGEFLEIKGGYPSLIR